MAGKRDGEMREFWACLPPKLKASLWRERRRLVVSSEEVPLQMVHLSRYKATPKFYLFTDIFAMVQGATVTEYPLEETWIEHMVPVEGMLHSVQNMSCFRLVFPESTLELHCKELAHKSKWVSSIAETLGIALKLSQFTSGRGDLNLDTQLELLRTREYLEYTFHSIPEFKDGRYKGQWKNAKPHGIGEFCQESTGRLYKGGFKDGKFHGEGDLHWFLDKDTRKKFIGEFRNGEMEGHGELKLSNGDVYSGRWVKSQRSGFGRLEETSKKGSFFTGSWENDKRNGYGIYEDKMRHERYLGMWVDDVQCGPGMFVTSSGTYCEATFANNAIVIGNDGFVIDPSGRSFMGKLGPDLKLSGKGLLTLTNGTTIEGIFAGYWKKKIEVQKGVLEDPDQREEETDTAQAIMTELQVAKLDKRIGNCTVLACNKWLPIFAECEASLGFRGDAANDVFSAWNKLATEAFHKKVSISPDIARRSQSLCMHGRTVKLPVDLIPLERARALTSGTVEKGDTVEKGNSAPSTPATFPRNLKVTNKSLSLSSDVVFGLPSPVPITAVTSHSKPEISRPINLEESLYSSYPTGGSYRVSSPYAPRADGSPPCETVSSDEPDEGLDLSDVAGNIQTSGDLKTTIQRYVDKAFNTPSHPLGTLMNRLEVVFHESYGGIGANKFLLPHAIAETHSIIQRVHTIVRILFPFLSEDDQNLSQFGLMRVEGFSDPDDYVSIESGYGLLHPLVFMRLFPTLIMLYVLHHAENDRRYQRGLDFLKEMDDDRLVHFIRFPNHICQKIVGKGVDGALLTGLDQASNTLSVVNSLFTPGEFLEHFKDAFKLLNNIEQLSGDFLLPAVVFILVRANVPHLGAYLHFLTDFAHAQPEDDYTLVTYEAAYNFIKKNSPGSS